MAPQDPESAITPADNKSKAIPSFVDGGSTETVARLASANSSVVFSIGLIPWVSFGVNAFFFPDPYQVPPVGFLVAVAGVLLIPLGFSVYFRDWRILKNMLSPLCLICLLGGPFSLFVPLLIGLRVARSVKLAKKALSVSM